MTAVASINGDNLLDSQKLPKSFQPAAWLWDWQN